MNNPEVILREFPPNPNLVNYHTRRQLTTMMSERYTPHSDKYPESWIAALGDISGLTNIHIMRHKLRVKRNPEFQWDRLTPEIQKVLENHWTLIEIEPVSNDVEDRKKFNLSEDLYFEKRAVYEGVRHAQQYDLAAELYAIEGITTLIFYEHAVTIKRGYCYPWEELSPQIKKVLEHFNS